MNIRALKLYCDVVARRSFTAAADENGMSQSAASQVVQQLEERLGTLLLDRSRRPFVLTPEGEAYFEGCQRIVRDYDQLETKVKDLHDTVAGNLTIAAIYSVGLAHMRAFVQQFRARHGHATVRLDYLHPDRVIETVERGGADLGLVSYPNSTRTLEVIPWRSEVMVVVFSPDHFLAGESSIEIEKLADTTLICFEQGLKIREEIDRVLLRSRVRVERTHEFDNIETIKQAVEVGSGVAILPAPTVEREVALGILKRVRLEGDPLARPLGILHRRHNELPPAAKEFIDMLASEVSPTNANGSPMPAAANASC